MTPITYKLLPSQKKFLHTDADVTLDICLYQGGYGSGKTWVGALLGILLCQKYPGILGLVLAKTYTLLRDTTLRTYLEHLDHFGLIEGQHYTYHQSQARMVFHCWGNSEILFRHMQTPESIKSLSVGWIECEEMSQFNEEDFNMIMSRIRQANISKYRIFGHTNPQGYKGWIYKVFVEKKYPKLEIENNGRMITVHYRRILAPTTENIFLPPHYVENMKHQFDEEYYRMNVLGEDGDYTAGLVCKTWSNANLEDTPYRPEQRIYLSCDFNVDPMCWVLAHRFNREYHFFDEICLENTTTLEAVEEFAKRYPEHTAGITLTGDASGNNRSTTTLTTGQTNYTLLRNRLSELGYKDVRLDLRNANPPVLDRVAAWNSAVSNQEGVIRVKVHPQCQWLRYNCENLKYVMGTARIWEPTPYEISKDPTLKFIKHIWDAASYLVERYDPILLKVTDEPARRNQFISRPFQP